MTLLISGITYAVIFMATATAGQWLVGAPLNLPRTLAIGVIAFVIRVVFLKRPRPQ